MFPTVRITTLLGAGVLALGCVHALAQQPQVAPRGTSVQPRIPYGNEMGFFRPQSDPALTRIVPPAAPPAPPAAEAAAIPVPPLEERLRWSELQMDRAESEAALQRAEANKYLPGPPAQQLPTVTEAVRTSP